MIEESAIRERAYALWEKDARPEGAAEFYWYLARQQLEAQVHAQVAGVFIKKSDPVKSATYSTSMPREHGTRPYPKYAKAARR